jgi:cyclic beta-1,2-glucan synthetase
MGSTQPSTFDLESISLAAGPQPAFDVDGKAIQPREHAHCDDPIERALLEALQWQAVEPEILQRTLDSRWRITAERISTAIQDAQKRSQGLGTLWASFKIISDNLPVLKQALLEARTGIQDSRKLPHVRISGTKLSVPRSFELAAVFLRSAEYQFDDDQCARFLIAVQERMALKMAEIWNLKAFLAFTVLEQIGNELSRLSFRVRNGVSSSSSTLAIISSRLACLVSSLLRISNLELRPFFQQVCETERVLRSDPQGAYALMDKESCQIYRTAVAEFAARSRCTEPEVARKAVELATLAQQQSSSSRERWRERRTHVGYYLVDAGQVALKKEIGHRSSLLSRVRGDFLKWPDFFYLIGIELITLAVIALLFIFLHVKLTGLVAMALFLLPAAECAVATMNLFATRLFHPRKLPKLDFSKGIPNDCATVVTVPTLLTSADQVRLAVRGLEIRFLANQDRNLHFVLLTDLPDSDRQFDDKEHLAALCSDLIRSLNKKYGGENRGGFFHFHRHRIFNESEGVWMGWERKRGKLLDFNRFLLHQEDRFPVKTGNLSRLNNIRYVITLDLDTQLPPGAGRRLVGALVHPLNRAVIDPATNTVTDGYGILQPRVDISIKSSSRSRFASLLSGDTGFDIYTRAVSDVYQDLFGEGIFTGKGIYEVETFQKVLEHRLPRNLVLSHDLIEGCYARTGLASDIAVIDDYPSHFSAFSQRKHRWVRGDWQIIFGLLPWMPNDSGQMVRNPLSQISRWKILDNLRRSLMDVATLLMFLCGWVLLPHQAVAWTLAALALMLFPTYFDFIFSVLTAGKAFFRPDFWRSWCSDFATANARIFVRLAFLLQQSLINVDAVVRTIVRLKFTHKRLLEWETAADAESASKGTNLADFYLKASLLISSAISSALFLLHVPSLAIATPILQIWGLSILICKWLNRPQRPLASQIGSKDRASIRHMSLRTWRFFRQFSNQEENWLVPDIVQETPPLVAHRISPTNLGLLLNARQAAHDLGYMTVQEFVQDTERTLDTFGRMPKCRGHLYNWYTTDTLEPVEPCFISTVDNGNLLCSLWTLKHGCLEMIQQPLFSSALWEGIRDHVDQVVATIAQAKINPQIVEAAQELKRRIDKFAPSDPSEFGRLQAIEIDAMLLLGRMSRSGMTEEAVWWAKELSIRLTNFAQVLDDFAPWLRGQFVRVPAELEAEGFVDQLTLESIPHLYQEICGKLAKSSAGTGDGASPGSPTNLRAALERSARLAADLVARLNALAEVSERAADEMDFSFLYDPKKKTFSIGYERGEPALSKYDYDLLASEARAAVFVAVAKGEAPQESWFHLKRSYRSYKREDVLLSWTGTTFEYLMPCLWIKAFPNTLLERSARAAVRAQQKFAKEHAIPWGISESSCNQRNPDGHYRYHAFGVSGLAIHRDDCSGDLVVAPYASFLGLLVDPLRAVKNLQRMKDLGWLSTYGFYEASDFTPKRVSGECDHVVVRNWMAHHQAMSLVAAANVLCDSAMQRRFHAEPRVAATERLLHERQPRTVPYEEDGAAASESSSALLNFVQIQNPGFRDLVPKLS